jgi:hypothetical protein
VSKVVSPIQRSRLIFFLNNTIKALPVLSEAMVISEKVTDHVKEVDVLIAGGM